jgi:hypothetical protein
MRFPVIVAALCLLGCSLTAAESVPQPRHVFEPVVGAMNTNARGIYPLPKAWVGAEKVTYSDATGGVTRENRRYRFDSAEVYGDVRHPIFSSRWAIGTRGKDGLEPDSPHAYHERLPTDAELAAIRDDATLRNAFNRPFTLPPAKFDAAGYGSETRYFTLGSNNTLQTLSVMFYKDRPGTNIQSVTIRRGTFHREGVWWYP